MFTADIPPKANLMKKAFIFDSNAGSRDDIFKFIKQNAQKIFGTTKLAFTNKTANVLNAVIK